MVRLFFYKAGTKEQYDGDEAVLIESAWINKTDADGNNVTTTNYEPIKIPVKTLIYFASYFFCKGSCGDLGESYLIIDNSLFSITTPRQKCT